MKYIFEGIKMLACKDHEGQWWKVEQDCVQCGMCCKDVPPTWVFKRNEDGSCVYLEQDGNTGTYFCVLGARRPFGCCGNSPHSNVEYCKVVLVKTDDPSSLL